MVGFIEVKQILETAIANWRAANGNAVPNLTGKHRDPNFGWSTKPQLLAATAKGFRLIEPGKIGNKQGADTNLVKALRDKTGVDNNGRMPDQGPYLDLPTIQKIIDWIDGGCPD